MHATRESSTYQATLEEGRVAEARNILLLQGRACFGEPDILTSARLAAIDDLGTLESLSVRLLNASTWSELLGGT